MRVLLASEPGAAERPNEDFAAAIPGAVVLLDGAGYVPDSATGCMHGVAWYPRTLGGLLAAGPAMTGCRCRTCWPGGPSRSAGCTRAPATGAIRPRHQPR